MNFIGHEKVIRYFSQGVASDRLSPSLLFVGPEGIGKRAAALELAKCFACLNPPKKTSEFPRCNECEECQKVGKAGHPDVLLIDRQLQSVLLGEKSESQTAIKIEAIRHADQFLHLKPLESRRRVVIIDEGHRMTNEAANALLKTLEEPPAHSQIIVIGVDEHGFPPTVVSRCAVLRFRPLPVAEIEKWLLKEQGIEESKAASIAERSGGSFSKALELMGSEDSGIDVSDYKTDEFFDLVGQINWKKEGRKNAERTLIYLIEQSRKKLEEGDLSQQERLAVLLKAYKRLSRNVAPRLVLENVYMSLQ